MESKCPKFHYKYHLRVSPCESVTLSPLEVTPDENIALRIIRIMSSATTMHLQIYKYLLAKIYLRIVKGY
jgi:hypothetical protein